MFHAYRKRFVLLRATFAFGFADIPASKLLTMACSYPAPCCCELDMFFSFHIFFPCCLEIILLNLTFAFSFGQVVGAISLHFNRIRPEPTSFSPAGFFCKVHSEMRFCGCMVWTLAAVMTSPATFSPTRTYILPRYLQSRFASLSSFCSVFSFLLLHSSLFRFSLSQKFIIYLLLLFLFLFLFINLFVLLVIAIKF